MILATNDPSKQLTTLRAWLQLDYTPKLPLEAVRAWLGSLGSAQAVLEATHFQLAKIVTEDAATAFKNPSDKALAYIDAALNWLQDPAYVGTRHILTWDSPDYPQQLLTITDPPLTLFVQGNPVALSQPAVGIVGARNATQQGIANARVFAQSLADKGVTVISGMALGIDAAAHEGALNASNNSLATVAVIGTGIDRIYPAVHRDLAHRIAAQGAIVSEFPIASPPLSHHFPRRNRLISGLSRGVLVVEAALRSGSLITARVAGEQGREVLAIPGSIHAPLSKGCHQLIKQGAKLVESAQDVLEELRLDAQSAVPYFPDLPGEAEPYNAQANHKAAPNQHPLLALMGHDPISIEQLSELSQLPTGDLLSQLTELELFGDVERLDGVRYQRLQRR